MCKCLKNELVALLVFFKRIFGVPNHHLHVIYPKFTGFFKQKEDLPGEGNSDLSPRSWRGVILVPWLQKMVCDLESLGTVGKGIDSRRSPPTKLMGFSMGRCTQKYPKKLGLV